MSQISKINLAFNRPLGSAQLNKSLHESKVKLSRQGGSSFKEAIDNRASYKEISENIRGSNDSQIANFVNGFVENWKQTEISAKKISTQLNPELRDLFSLNRSVSRLSLHTQIIEKLAEAFSSTVKSLQKSAGG